MPARVVPIQVFEQWLAKEYRKQDARVVFGNTISKYRAYAVGNALAMWRRSIAGVTVTDSAMTESLYRNFYGNIKRGSKSNAAIGANEGYTIVLRMLERAGISF